MTAAPLLLLLIIGGASAAIPDGIVGGKCLLNQPQTCSLPNSECIEGTCLCANFYRFVNDSCVTADQSVSLGVPCRSGGDCRGPGEFCSSFSVCMCLSTHVDVGSQCRPAVYPGQFGCEDSRQCNKGFPGAECDTSRRCVCPLGMIAQQQTCVLPSVISTAVLSDSIRHSPPSNFFSRRRLSPPSSYSPNGIAPDAVCSVDSDCSGYPLAFCDGVCRCVTGSLNAGSTCIASNNALQPVASCPAGQTYVAEAGACMTVQQPGEPCQYSQQCSSAEPGAFCLRLRCECVYGMKQSGTGCTFVDNQCPRRGFIWIPELGECKEVLPPGGRGCSHNLQCTQAYAEAKCFLQTCTCPINFPVAIDGTCGRNCSAGETYSGVTGQCLPTVKPGDQCLYSSQCHAINPGMICDRNTCRCPTGTVFSGSKCTQQCPVGFMVNSKGVCAPGCRVNQVEHEGECLDQVSPGTLCIVNAQCMGGASCQNGACACPKAMMPRGSVCVFVESPPSGPCGDGQQCTGGSFCSNGNCTCPSGRQIVNGQCVTPLTVPPNSPCNPSVTCGGGSTCLGSVCTCPANQQSIEGRCQVPRAVAPGNPCPTGTERCLGQSTCLGGVCQCPFGTYASANECLPIQASQPGAPCDMNTRCTGLAVCVQGTCQCPEGLIASNGDCRAATQVAPGSSCALGEVCIGGSSCVAQICTCPRSTRPTMGVCQPVASVNPGQSCTNGEICSGGSNCQLGLCTCPPGSVNFEGTCQSAAGSLGQCDSEFRCEGGAVCDRTRNQCTCPANTILVGRLCISSQTSVANNPETVCHYDVDCLDGRVCVLQRCSCIFGELPDGSCRNLWARRLYRKPEVPPTSSFISSFSAAVLISSTVSPVDQNVEIGGACVRVGVSCGGGSICVAGVCVCPLGMTPWQNTCVEHRTAKPGESCSRGEECTAGSACNENTRRCECIRASQMVIGNTCQERLRSHPGYPCSNGEMCVGGSSCRDGRCSCAEGKIEVNKQCVDRPTVGAGDACGNGEVCAGGSECNYQMKKCLCKRGQQIVNNQCVEMVVVPAGESCAAALVRCGGGAYCVRGRCECPTNMVPIEGKCIQQKQVPPGKACSSAEICMGRSVCRDGTCQCTSDMILVGTNCEVRKKVRPLENCRQGDECLGGSRCNGHTCECPAGHVVRHSMCQPRLTKRPGSRCSPEDICVGQSICIRGQCQCRPGERPVNGVCSKTPQVIPGGSCSVNDECLGGSKCRGGVCMCPTGQTTVAHVCKTVIKAIPGDSCAKGETCDGGSFCHQPSKMCRCQQGFMIYQGKCMPLERRIPTLVSVLSRPSPSKSTLSPRPTCRSNSDCLRESICRGGLCACPLHLVLRNGACVPANSEKRRPGLLKEPCDSNDQCAVTNSFCTSIGLCGCLPGYRLFGSTQCIKHKEPKLIVLPTKTTATTTTTATITTTTTTTEPSTTSPATEQIPSTTEEVPATPMIEIKLPGMECDDRSLCQQGSSCIQGVCRCTAGFMLVHNNCVRRRPNKIVAPLSSCMGGEVCGGGSVCFYGLCFCTDDRTLFRGECLTVEEIDLIRETEIDSATTKISTRFMKMITTTPMSTSTTEETTTTTLTTTTEATTVKTTTIPSTTTKMTTERTFTKKARPVVEVIPTIPSIPTVTSTLSTTTTTAIETSRKPMLWFKVARPGFECDEFTQCTNCSVCENGFCSCPEGLVLANERCLSPIDARSCLASNQCPSGAECVAGECRCAPGLAISRFGFCMPLTYVDPGMSCKEGEMCRGGSECKEGMCVCSEGLFVRDNKCLPAMADKPRVKRSLPTTDDKSFVKLISQAESLANNGRQPLPLGERCSIQTVCSSGGVCRQGFCRCPESQVQAGTSCLQRDTIGAQIVSPGANCQEGVFCDGGASCVAFVCRCPSGFEPSSGVCSPILVKASDDCSAGQRCSSGSLCVQGKCVCPRGFANVEGNCIAIGNVAKSPGISCLQNPFVCTGGSSCVSGICTCPLGTESIGGTCTPSTGIISYSPPGGPCAQQVVCTGNSVCANGFCVCPGGERIRNGVCVSVDSQADPGQICQEGVTVCTGNSFCTNGQCTCPTGQTSLSGQCVRVVTTNVCNPPCGINAQCTSNGCQCNPGFVFYNGQCLPPCSAQCSPNGFCRNGACVCNTGFVFSNGQCQPQCSQNYQCTPNSSCQQGVCICNTGYALSQGLCLPQCNSNFQCSPNSSCQQGICSCNQGFVYSQGQCSPPCPQQCHPNASCQQGSCQCNPGFILNQGQCSPQCSSNAQCYPNSSCQQGMCTCNQGYVFSQGQCSPQFSPQCSPQCQPNAYCQQGTCVCNTGFAQYQDQCAPVCSSTKQCSPNSFCQQGVCTCNQGYVFSQGQCTPQLSPQCSPQCQPNASCQQGSCLCNPGFAMYQGQCAPQCNPNSQCFPNASCQQGVCACNQGFTYSQGQCSPSCSPQCQPNASCQMGTCQCNPGYNYNPGGQCQPSYNPSLPIDPFFGLPGQPCDNRQGALLCRNRGLCVNNQCVCPTNLVLAGRACVEFAGDAYPGQSCSSAGIICRGGASCSQGTCLCSPGYFPVGNQCIQFSFSFSTQSPFTPLIPGSRCNPQCQFQPCLQNCGGGSFCVEGVCTCPIGTYPFDGRCIPMAIDPATTTLRPITSRPTARPGDVCDVTVGCTGGSSCIIGQCTCDPGYAPSFDRSSCVRTNLPVSQRSYPGGKCTKDSDCMGNSFCSSNGMCACPQDEEINGNTCTKRTNMANVYPGSPCPSNMKCAAGSICSAGYCVCPSSTTTDTKGHCVSVLTADTSAALPGASCRIRGPQCEGGSQCLDGHCVCRDGSRNEGDAKCSGGNSTQIVVPPTAAALVDNKSRRCSSFHECDEPRVCSSAGVCECPFTMTETSFGVCIYRHNLVPLGSFCDGSSARCQPPAQCISRRCTCPSGLVERGSSCQKPLTVPLQSACLPGDQCVDGASCDRGICKCTHGTTADNTACRLINKRELRLRPPSERLSPCPSDGSCRLPDCFCSGTGTVPPGGFESRNVPQMVILSFDDPVTDRVINIYKSLFSGKFRNPNGCPIKGTFFVSHQFNNYDQTQWLHSRGNEIALNSITHEKLTNASKERWRHEMVGQRESLRAFSYVDPSSVKGVRAPHQMIGGDEQFDMMKENGLLYDNSMTAQEGPVWPQTLDHQLAWDCGEQKCPERAHPGLWSLPLQLVSSNDGIWHSLFRTAIKPYDNRETTLRLLQRNFYRNYNGNRAPFILNADSEFLTYLPDNGVVHAVEDWLKEILNKTDVYVVTASQAIEWMKNPVETEKAHKFKPWQCSFRLNDHVQPCETPSICSYDSRGPSGMPHSFRVCGSCPRAYPWIEDPLGRKQLRV